MKLSGTEKPLIRSNGLFTCGDMYSPVWCPAAWITLAMRAALYPASGKSAPLLCLGDLEGLLLPEYGTSALETRLHRLQSSLRSAVYQVLMGEKL